MNNHSSSSTTLLHRFCALLQRCAAAADVQTGQALHALYVKSLLPNSTFLSNHLLHLYSKSRLPSLARLLFDEIPHPNTFSYNALLSAYARVPSPRLAHQLFLQIPDPDLVSYNTLLSAYASAGRSSEVLTLFLRVRREGVEVDGFTLSCLLSVLKSGVGQVHGLVVSGGFGAFVSVGNALISSYSRSGDLAASRQAFEEMGGLLRDGVSWNCIIMACGKHGEGGTAMAYFREMVGQGCQVDAFTLASVLTAFTSEGDLKGGTQFHGRLIKVGCQRSSHCGGGLVDLYSKSGGMIGDAEKVFDEVVAPDLVLWNAMMSAYLLNAGCAGEALACFRDMRRADICPDYRSFVSAIIASVRSLSQALGEQVHSLSLKLEFAGERVPVENALVTMYSKFGRLEDAMQVFERMMEHDAVSYNTMIAGYAQHGRAVEAVALFRRMLEGGRVAPTGVTFVSVLSACAHTGSVDEGCNYFSLMERRYGIRPCEEHYTCMIDILGRAGRFEQAEKLIETMALDPGAIGWTSLLSSCRTHGNYKLGVKAASQLIRLEPSNAAAYVTLSNMHARMGKWEEVSKVRELMRDRRVKKNTGYSWAHEDEDASRCND